MARTLLGRLVRLCVAAALIVGLYLWQGWGGIAIGALSVAVSEFWQRVVLKDDD